VRAEDEGEFGGVVRAFPWTGRDVGEIAGVVVAECCCICCVSVSKSVRNKGFQSAGAYLVVC
jgi:hypothetical protein